MNTTEKTVPLAEISQRNVALIAGFAYLMIFIVGAFANLFAFEKLIVLGDAVASANNIIAHKSLFRLGIAGWLVVIIFDTLAAWAFYIFLKPINESLSLLAAWFRLAFVAIFAYSFVSYLSVLQLFSGASYLNAFNTDQLQAQAMALLYEHEFAVHVSFAFFGLHIFVLGCLALKSDFIPRILGIMLIVASCGYLINSFGNFVSSEYASNKITFVVFVAVPAVISEFSLTMWLLFKGGKSKINPIANTADLRAS